MTAARAQVAIRGWGPFRHPTVEFGDGAVWLEFIGTCRPRGMLRQP
jgi:hypothetical protein